MTRPKALLFDFDGVLLESEFAGTGIGLAIVQRITAAHDGTLALAPRPGGGLVVTVALPHGR